MQNNRFTFIRYIYLNTYAYLLLLAGIGIVFIPLHSFHRAFLIPQIIAALFFINLGIKILKRWKEKKRSYHILIERNSTKIHHESFKEYMQAPCGRLIVKVVLKDLGESRQYKILKKRYNPSFKECLSAIKTGARPKKTVVTMYSTNSEGRLTKTE